MVTASDLEQMYWYERKSKAAIAQEIGRSLWWIDRRFVDWSIPVRESISNRFHELVQESTFDLEKYFGLYIAGSTLFWNSSGSPYWVVSSVNHASIDELAHFIEWEAGIDPIVSFSKSSTRARKVEIYGFRRMRKFCERFYSPWLEDLDQVLEERRMNWDEVPTDQGTRQRELALIMDNGWITSAELREQLGWPAANIWAALKTAERHSNVEIESIGHLKNQYRWVGEKPWYLKLAYGIYRTTHTVPQLIESYAQSLGVKISGPLNPYNQLFPQYIFNINDCTFCFFDMSPQLLGQSRVQYDFTLVLIGHDIDNVGAQMAAFKKRLRGKKKDTEDGSRLVRPLYGHTTALRELYKDNPASLKTVFERV